MPKLSVIIPAYNEEVGIANIIEQVLDERDNIVNQTEITDVELIVVNDGSKDNTGQIASTYDDVVLINHEANKGYGAALKTGFKHANGELLSFFDADGTYPPQSLPKLCQTLLTEDADIVIGSRLSGEKTEMPKVRRVGNKLFASLLSWIGNRKISDAASGMRVFKKEILPRLYPLPDGLNFTPAMSTRAIHEDLKMVEVPIPYAERAGRSKLNAVKDGFRFLRSIVGTALLYNPLKFFGIVGLLSLLMGIIIGAQPVIHYLSQKQVPGHYIYRLLVVLILFAAGMNIISFGVLSNYILSIWHRKNPKYGLLSRLVYNKYSYGKFDLLGACLILAGVGLNIPAMYQYATTRMILVHWSYFVTGGFLILTGVQLLTSSILIKIMEKLSERETEIQNNLL